MFSKVYGATVYGIDGALITVEADVSDGLPSFSLVGYLSSEVREAKERVRVAIKNSGFFLQVKKITINLSPADRRKEGTGFDLPIAIAILIAYGFLPRKNFDNMVFAGELGLDGRINPVRGILPILLAAKEAGKDCCIIPADNLAEGEMLSGIKVFGVGSLKELAEVLAEEQWERLPRAASRKAATVDDKRLPDFQEVIGQSLVKRAVEIAVAGGHNLLMMGPPGTGKSMIAERIPSIMPEPGDEERMEIARIYSVAGLLGKDNTAILKRPFRSPHHTITPTALAGGGRLPVPGEISLASHGVLFLDEFPEFDRRSLEVLRQPMEEKKVHVARLEASYDYPADFMLVAAMNPCPCGFYPDRNKCRCTQGMIRNYLGKISHPLLDRIDICVEAAAVSFDDLETGHREESSLTMGKRVAAARKLQAKRFAGSVTRSNSAIRAGDMDKYCFISQKDKAYMKDIFERCNLSARAYHKILKVARTIADLEGSEKISRTHLQEAVCYRGPDEKYWKNQEEM